MMKRKTFLFLAAALVIHFALVMGYKALMADSALMKSDRVLHTVGNETQVLIAGHSHTMALETDVWEGAVNISSAGENLHQSYFKLRYAIEKLGSQPEVIVIPFDLGALRNYDPTKQNYQSYWNKYEDFKELARFSESKINFWAYRLTGGMLPYQDGLHDLVDFLFADSLAQNEAMRMGGKDKINQRPDTLHRAIDRARFDDEFSAYGLHFLRATAELALSHDVELVLVRFPVTRGHYFSNSSKFDPDEYYTAVTDSLDEWGASYRILDFHDAFPDSSFRDPHHLKAGAVRQQFTEMVKAAL